MREILFRGKRKDNDEWVEGDLIQIPCGVKFIVNNKFGVCIDGNGNFINTEAPFVCEVIPETVGQFTGLTDKNDNKIFESDILETEGPDGADYQDVVHFGRFNDDDNHGNEYIGFYVKSGNYITSLLEMPLGKHNYCYVIGNVYDNPELLEDMK